jgi:nitrate reductase gamma subunit
MTRRHNLLWLAAGVLAGFILGFFAATQVWQALMTNPATPEWVHSVLVLAGVASVGGLVGLAAARLTHLP